jgi:ribosomal protein L11 methyltransferase
MSGQQWLEISVHADGEAAEAISEVFNRYGHGGAVIEHLLSSGSAAHDDIDEMIVKTYIAPDNPDLRQQIREALWHLGQLYPIAEPSFRVLSTEDWAEAWKAHYAVLHVGRQTVIVPQWLEYWAQPGEVIVTLDPGMAFGTGTHPTTRLCLTALEALATPGMNVLDLGTGSGILAISAAKQGAASVLALDVDEIAVAAAQENVAANDVGSVVHVEAGSVEKASGPYDLILVNILAGVICELMGRGLTGLLKPGGTLVASGIIDCQEAQVREALSEQGLKIVNRLAEQDWLALITRSASAPGQA